MRSRNWLLLSVAVVASTAVAVGPAAATPLPAAAAPSTPAPAADVFVEDGGTQPVFSMDDAIEETAYVETTVDSDHDGQRDRVHVHVVRPGGEAAEGREFPVILQSSPYFFGVNEVENHSVDFPELPQEILEHPSADAARPGDAGRSAPPPTLNDIGRQGFATTAEEDQGLPGWLDDYFVPRGYAVVWGEAIGSAHSRGCPTIGDMQETLGVKAIVDWFNGRAEGWTDDGEPVAAGWTNGDTGMVGVSYNGTLPNMVATTGVDGLKTIVPISAISNWYDYYRANGLVVAPGGFQGEDADVLAEFTVDNESCTDEIDALEQRQDRVTGDYSQFWHARDYVHRARGVDASVWVIHGLNDWNVKTQHFAQWWGQLDRHQVPRKMWLHQGAHGGTDHDGAFRPTLHRWFDHWLYGLDTGVMDEPMVDVQREDGSWATYADWPDPAVARTRVHLVAHAAEGPGSLSLRPVPPGRQPDQGFVDRGRELTADDLVANPDVANPNRVAYLAPDLEADVRMSGTPIVRLRASVDDHNAANLTALLVDYGPDGAAEIVTRGWMDPQNRRSASRSQPIKQGTFYRFRWNMQPDDYVFEAGHRLGVVIISTDHDYTLRPLSGTHLTVDPGHSEILLPIVGGRDAIDW